MRYTIWYGEDKEAGRYLVEITQLKKFAPRLARIEARPKRFVENPPALREILYLDRPDLVVTEGEPERPVFGVEFCAEAPSGHNIAQRLARVAAAAEFGMPFAFVFPERKWIRRRGAQERWDEYNPFPLRVLSQIGRFHSAPILAFFWPADERRGDPRQGYLLCDRKYPNLPDREHGEMKALAAFLNLAVSLGQHRAPSSEMVFHPLYMERERWMGEKYHDKMKRKPTWSPLTSARVLRTKPALLTLIRKQTRIKPVLPAHVLARNESVIYEPKTATFRSDPYAGNLVGIDYHECRNGPTPRHRYRNLVINFASVSFEQAAKLFRNYHKQRCPMQSGAYGHADRYLTLHLRDGCRYTKQKELRIFCFLADVVLFKDALLF